MDVNVIGGGPGGLYTSLLLKQEYPDWDVTVYERDPADNTYGWGVVFSDATLSNLREADHASHDAITDAFVKWDPIDTYVDGERIRCGGHGFAGIMRTDLLSILQARAREVGVELQHDHDVQDPDAYREDADVLIGADGGSSMMREFYEDRFKPKIDFGDAKFAWFGTEKPFDVFTFIFRENEHGLWQIHAYPGRKSTFIVECNQATWEAAGMDEKGEDEALAYFEELFSDHLDGHALESKLYSWREFPIVKNRTWSFENVVLLGDAAHTAHFSIGSGTKLAMEDAIALWEAFEEKGTDVPAAFDWYEKERRPRVNGLQDAAERSQSYFEHVDRYRHLPPEQFTFNLLTRSGRITYDNLRIRDPGYVDSFDRWYARHEGEVGADEPDPVVSTPPLFKPLELRGVTLSNRTVLGPSVGTDADDGLASDDHLATFERQGRSRAGLVLTDPLAVSADGRITPGTAGLYEDAHAEPWAAAVDALHGETDAAVGAQLLHAGRRGAMRSRSVGMDRPLPAGDGWELLAPSPKAYTADGRTPTAMDRDEMDRVRDDFVGAAERAAAAGFDVLQLQAGHGYLLSSFLSPLANDREDEYGGSPEDRRRYPLEVVEAVRAAWPDDRPLGVTLNATDWHPAGHGVEEAFGTAAALDERGVDYLAVGAGQATAVDRPSFDPTSLADLCEAVRNEVRMPAMSTNYVTSFDEVNSLVGAARADLCRVHPDAFD
ncbi:MAG: FAD-dependent monooxygenase [Halobacteriales archaeon]|nr:FAD-dependent monooxygenase [Halobacteriales archaeon]